MECAEFRNALVTAGDSPELAEHAAKCPACAHGLIALAASLGSVEAGTTEAVHAGAGPEELRRLESALAGERGVRGRLRSLPTARRKCLVLATVAASVALLAGLESHAALTRYPAWQIALLALAYALALTALVFRALRPMHRLPSPGRDRALLGGAFALPFLIGALPRPELQHAVAGTGHGRDCITLGVLLGLAFFAALRAVDRERRPGMHTRWLALAGASLSANAALLFHCPFPRPLHAWILHATVVPAFLLVLLGVAVGARALWLRLRPA